MIQRLLVSLFVLAASLTLSACATTPFSHPRERAIFRATSDFPHLPHVDRMTNAEGCVGEPLHALRAPMPDYPARGWSRGLQGWSIVQFDVERSGQVVNARIANGIPGGSFDREARKALENWQFKPLISEIPLRGCVVLFEFRMGEVRVR